MARLNDSLDSDYELPDLSTIIRTLAKAPKQEHGKVQYQRNETQDLPSEDLLTEAHTVASRTVTKVSSDKPQSRRQRPLEQAYINTLLLPMSDPSTSNPKSEGYHVETADRTTDRASPRRLTKGNADYGKLAQASVNKTLLIRHDEDSSTDLSGFIVPDSASDGETLVSRSPTKKKIKKIKSRAPKKTSTANPREPVSQKFSRPQSNTRQPLGTTATPPEEKDGSRVCLESPPSNEPSRSEPFEAHPTLNDRLTFSLPGSRPPCESEGSCLPLTPSSNPPKSKLKSPSKRHPIPPTPHRPSIDAFWSQDVINGWNEQYSPRKTVESPRRLQFHSVREDEELSPSGSPRKSPVKSPARKDRKVVAQRKLFDDTKHDLATTFLAEVDQTITNGKLASMADSTGGIQIIWSKKLSSTAGRANWRREVIRSKNADGYVSDITHRHHASIELAEKVIDDEERLINVVAHEYCHLANFMISGVKDNPHGKEFKEWARKCSNAFSHRAINVTTKHTYTIAYKYIWTCISSECGLEYKRHSKSIDPSKHSCGHCKGKLVQVQPAPRKGAGQGKRSEYQDFVKREHERVRLENPGAGFGEIMSILGREFKECKRNDAERVSVAQESGALEKVASNELKCLDSVVRKLEFLDLES